MNIFSSPWVIPDLVCSLALDDPYGRIGDELIFRYPITFNYLTTQ